MLRLLYLLSLLLYIESSFCYNYLDDATERNINKYGRNVRRERDRRFRRTKERKNLVRQEYDYDRSPVEFDVASFIQPDEESVDAEEEGFRHHNKKRRRTSKSYDYGTIIGMNVDDSNKKREKSPDYLNMGDNSPDLNINSPLYKDTMNPKHLNFNSLDDIHSDKYGHDKYRNIYKDDLLMDQNPLHSQEKKCTMKHIKFPFFSHNKSEVVKPKKNKKRRLFCFNCPKKDENGFKLPEENKMNDDPIIQYKMKRSYEEKLCPACKKKYVTNLELTERRKKTPKRVIHNSRQFFQTPEAKLKEDLKNARKDNGAYSDELRFNYRIKRDEADRERQIKELEEVQRKIDNVEIHMPKFEKPAETK